MGLAFLWDWWFQWRRDRREESIAKQSLAQNDTKMAIELLDQDISTIRLQLERATCDLREPLERQLDEVLQRRRAVIDAALRGQFPQLFDVKTGAPRLLEASGDLSDG